MLIRSGKILRSALNTYSLALHKNVVRHSSVTTWNKDWKPGPYPRTKEQRDAAAKKYGMIPEDYQPYPEVEGFGDYPMFKKTHMETRNPFEAYDFPTLKRNYNEPMHPDMDMCTEDKVNFERKFKTPLWKQFCYLTSVVVAYATLIIWSENHLPEKDVIPKQYPHSGVVYYTFDSAKE